MREHIVEEGFIFDLLLCFYPRDSSRANGRYFMDYRHWFNAGKVIAGRDRAGRRQNVSLKRRSLSFLSNLGAIKLFGSRLDVSIHEESCIGEITAVPWGVQVYQVASGISSNSSNLPNSRFLYATGSCNVCVLTSLQNRSKPTLALVAFAPVTSNTPEVTRRLVSVVTTLTLATHSASSPRSRAVSFPRVPRSPPNLFRIASTSCPARSARADAARRCAWKFP